MKLNILIVDDNPIHHEWAMASLINVSSDYGFIKERVRLARANFEIHTFEVVGSAIKDVEAGFTPDLAIVDIDFSYADDAKIIKDGLNVEKEKTKTRGFDLLATLKLKCKDSINILFTGQSNKAEIDIELEKRGLEYRKDWFSKGDKGDGGEILTSKMPFLLKKAAEKIFEDLPQKKKTGLIEALDGFEDETDLLRFTPDINGRRIKFSSLLIGWSKAELNENDVLQIKYENLTDGFESLIKQKPTTKTVFRGSWKKNYLQTALRKYQSLKNYHELREEIDANAAQFLLEFCEQFESIKSSKGFAFTIRIEGYNCSNVSEDAELDFGKFKKVLICRRIMIGAVKLRDNRRTIRIDPIIAMVGVTMGREGEGGSDKQLYSTVLGLSGKSEPMIQIIRYDLPHIMDEEADWLKQYIPMIEHKYKDKDWSSFLS